MNFHNFNKGNLRDFYFGENRPVRLIGPDAGNALGGAWEKMKRDTGVVKEKYGVFREYARKPFYAQSTLGYIIKSPFILTRKLYEGVKTFNAKSTALARGAGGKVGEYLKDPLWMTVDTTRDLTKETVKAGWNLTGGMAMEVGRANFYEFPKRAFVDQFRTQIRTLFGTIGTFLGRSKDALVKTAIYPGSVINGCRKAVTNVLWNAPKALYNREYKEAVKSAFVNPFVDIGKGIGSAPAAILGVPYHTGMEVGLGLTETGVNIGRAMMAPAEGVVNAYGSMMKSKSLIDYLKGQKAEGYRGRFKDVFANTNPLARFRSMSG